MVTRAEIQQLADDIARQCPVEKIILFGSHAYGVPTQDSDVDLLVVMDHSGPHFRAASQIRFAVDVDFPIDVIVRSPRDLEARLREGDAFVEEILSRGVLLYEDRHERMDRKGGGRLRRRARAS